MLEELIQKLQARKIVTSNGCWEIDLVPNSHGYVSIVENDKSYYIHRISAAYYLGLDIENIKQLVCHKNECNNKKCWNPEHIYVGDHSKNYDDARKLGITTFGQSMKNKWKDVTKCKLGHDLVKRPNGKRYCQECNKIGNRRRWNEGRYK